MPRLSVLQAGAVILAATLVGCTSAPPDPFESAPDINVTLYGRNGLAVDAWFVALPITDPISSVGFGRDMGVACWTVPAGSQLARVDHPPPLTPASIVQVFETLELNSDTRRSFWVNVGRDGRLKTGEGIPPWWPGGGGEC